MNVRPFELGIVDALQFYAAANVAHVCREAGLAPSQFADERLGLLYRASLTLVDKGQPVDALTLRAECEAQKIDPLETHELVSFGGRVPPPLANLAAHVEIILRAARARDGGAPVALADAQASQVGAALRHAELPARSFLPWPYGRLQESLGGLAPSVLVFLAGFAGGGKTSFLLSLICRWLANGIPILYAGLESRPHILRTQIACRVLSMDPGWILSGDYLADAAAARIIRDRLKAELARQREDDRYRHLHFAPHETISAKVVIELVAQAAGLGAVLCIDHVDHGAAEGRDYYAESRAVVSTLHREGQRHGVRIIAATQTNLSGLSHDKLRNHRPTRPEHVFMGNHKMQVADVVLGLFRPIRSNVTKQELAAVRDGTEETRTILAKNTVAINVMKHRLYGERMGSIVELGFWHGDVTEQPLMGVRSA